MAVNFRGWKQHFLAISGQFRVLIKGILPYILVYFLPRFVLISGGGGKKSVETGGNPPIYRRNRIHPVIVKFDNQNRAGLSDCEKPNELGDELLDHRPKIKGHRTPKNPQDDITDVSFLVPNVRRWETAYILWHWVTSWKSTRNAETYQNLQQNSEFLSITTIIWGMPSDTCPGYRSLIGQDSRIPPSLDH